MIEARHWLDDPQPVDVACGRAEALLDALSPAMPAILYGAALSGEAMCIGAYQRRQLAVSGAGGVTDGVPAHGVLVVRRVTGGGSVYAGQGVFYVALLLNDASVLMDCPPGRILNRNVRGLLQGLRSLGVPSHYFGRDYVSLQARPGAYVAWQQREDGRVLLESFIAHDRVFVPPDAWIGYPPRAEDPFRGHAPVTLHEALSRGVEPATLFEHVVRGYALMYRADVRPLDANVVASVRDSVSAPTVTTTDGDDGLCWSSPHEESIGFVYAGVRVDAERRLSTVRVGGDYFQDRAGQAALEETLTGCVADGGAIGAAINGLYAGGGYTIEGIRQLDSLRAVVLSAAQAAQSRS